MEKKNPAGSKHFHDDTSVLMTELVLPSHTNTLGTIFGGTVMAWIDVAGAIAAMRYSKAQVVTVSVDYMHFIVPIKIGFTVLVHARVTYAGKTSMEVEVLVEAENAKTGEKRKATHAYLTYVALDEHQRPKQVPPYKPKGPSAKKELAAAINRRKRRLDWRGESA